MPLPYQPQNNDIPVKTPPTGFDALRTIAVSRIYLDNFDHITAYWVGLGMKLAQVALSYGADDLHGTIIEEHIFHSAGATSPQLQTEADMIKAIREAGLTPVRRNSQSRSAGFPVGPSLAGWKTGVTGLQIGSGQVTGLRPASYHAIGHVVFRAWRWKALKSSLGPQPKTPLCQGFDD